MVDPGTGRREHEESPADRQLAQLRQAERLESLGALAGGIAHDFNNLLAVILSYASFVSAELAVPSGPDWPNRLESARRDLGQITLAAERAASLTRQLLSSVQQEMVRPQALDLDDDATDLPEMLRRTRGEHVGLVSALAVDLWPVLADPAQQALLSAIMASAGGSAAKQAFGADLMNAGPPASPPPSAPSGGTAGSARSAGSAGSAGSAPPGLSIPDPRSSGQLMARLRDHMVREDPLAALTGQEKRVLELIGEGLTNRQIAERMYLAEKTAKNYVSSLLAKLGMHRRTEAAAFAARHPRDHDD
jgi:DNA-binding CsgD family transcriptional regulator